MKTLSEYLIMSVFIKTVSFQNTPENYVGFSPVGHNCIYLLYSNKYDITFANLMFPCSLSIMPQVIILLPR